MELFDEWVKNLDSPSGDIRWAACRVTASADGVSEALVPVGAAEYLRRAEHHYATATRKRRRRIARRGGK